jgi:integrase
MPSSPRRSAEPREVKPGTFALRAYIGRSPTGSPLYLHETYVSPRADTGITEARRRLRKLELRAKKARTTSNTFGALLDKWLEHAASLDRSPTTLNGYRARVRVIKDALGSIPLDTLNAGHLDAWYAALKVAGKSPADRRAYHRVISAALSKGEKWRDIDGNPARLADPPSAEAKPFAPPSPERVKTLIRLAEASRSTFMASVIAWAAITGMRRGELCGLRWSDVDWNEANVNVCRSVYQLNTEIGVKDTKTHAEREVDVGLVGLAILDDLERRARADAEAVGLPFNPDGYIWSATPDGSRPLDPNTLTKGFTRLCRDAEKPARALAEEAGRELSKAERWPYRLHDLRHYSATELLNAGISVVIVAERLGHARPSTTTDIYGHGRKSADSAAAEILGHSIGVKPKELTDRISGPADEGHDRDRATARRRAPGV